MTLTYETRPRRDGSESVVAAALEHLGSDAGITLTAGARRTFRDIYDLAIRLRKAFRQTVDPDEPG